MNDRMSGKWSPYSIEEVLDIAEKVNNNKTHIDSRIPRLIATILELKRK